ncbi:extra-large guanine nucleotide-binding protein 1-like [Neltuma alba]|uniref:extra-large guanine nucleotide-binding protein 1-like n=1 Tax=Neltuma alba TaxID=207710 RepID=UPI0010A466A8|nr:extra-large guanine nucleotide-binding protein 1-like [Prosopis alba]
MASLLKKWLPGVPSSVSQDNDDHDLEYSIAMIYDGPAVNYSIPEIAPLKIDQIPIASVASISSDQLSVPIIQPIVKTRHANYDSKSNSHSSTIEFPNRISNSGSLGTDDKEEIFFQSDPNPANSEITESGSNSQSLSSEISSCRGADCKNDTTRPTHIKRPSTVTFRDPESDAMIVVSARPVDSQAGRYPVRPKVERTGNKGTCHRCHKGNRFTEKVICISCDAKYCRNCVIRAMGSMPEGRKCITCIGYRIDESKRRTLGKGSRMLKHLMSEPQAKQIIYAEKFSEANQIPPELVCVNGEQLNRKQMMSLLSSSNPPKKLKPGFYWYDKASGLWGKEGKRPTQFISPRLDVGGVLKENASNGNTNVFINGREITKEERWMLKAAGVACEGKPNFWVNADGSYKEEGQRNTKGYIWNKTAPKLVCLMLSLPRRPNSFPLCSEERVNTVTQHRIENKTLHKFLLVGSVKSGTSTIFKQAKLQYNVPFSHNELQNIKLVIQSNLYTHLGILLEGCEKFHEESLLQNKKRRMVNDSTSSEITGNTRETTIYSISPRLKAFSDSLIKYMALGDFGEIFPAATSEYASLVEELWRDAAIQATYGRRDELEMLPRNASYFLDRAVEISKTDYEPCVMDILYAEGMALSNSLASMEFSFPKPIDEDSVFSEYRHDPSFRYQLIRVHPRSLGENCKWLEMFEDMDVALFCVALTDYDEHTVDSNGVSTNKMLAAKHLFENMIRHPTFNDKKFLLILNKFDLFKEKIELVPLTQCEWFSDFNPVISHNQNSACTSNRINNTPLAHRAFQYIAVKFKKLFKSLTNRKLFVSLVTGLEPDTVDEALSYARVITACEKWIPPSCQPEIFSTTFEIEEASSF